MGFVIESETLAQLIDKRFIQSQYDAAWQLRLDEVGRINWVDRHAKKEIILKKEPATSFWKRLWSNWRRYCPWNGYCKRGLTAGALSFSRLTTGLPENKNFSNGMRK
mgnify:CR=1 FL=1